MDFLEEVVLHGDEVIGDLRIKIRELPMADGVHGSTGCQLWPSSIALAQDLLRRPQLVADKSVVELGAGCGLLGIAVARLARRTILTDGDEEAVRNLQFNLEVNEPVWRCSASGEQACNREVSTKVLRWGEAEEEWPADDRAQVVIGSDILYGHWGDKLAQACLHTVAPGGIIMVAAAEDRRSGARVFQEQLCAAGWHVSETNFCSQQGTFCFYECRERQPRNMEPATPVMHKASVTDPVASRECWRVVASAIVRDGFNAELSDMIGRLWKGALVQEIERTDSRLHYTKLEGQGPDTGWVSFVSGKGVKLLSSTADGR